MTAAEKVIFTIFSDFLYQRQHTSDCDVLLNLIFIGLSFCAQQAFVIL
jgi:hypothetical protein